MGIKQLHPASSDCRVRQITNSFDAEGDDSVNAAGAVSVVVKLADDECPGYPEGLCKMPAAGCRRPSQATPDRAGAPLRSIP
jgi:hypothetical protein